MAIRIFVEGIADFKLLKDLLLLKYGNSLIMDEIVVTKGWTNLLSEKSEGELLKNKMKQNSDDGGHNLLIFDADENFKNRFNEIKEWKENNELSFETFLLPNNSDSGDLETLLENIINKKNLPIFKCWEGYENCLSSITINGQKKLLTIPAKKSKIYGYLEALLGSSKSQKKLLKEEKRDYTNPDHWDLDSEYLNNLTKFLDKYFL